MPVNERTRRTRACSIIIGTLAFAGCLQAGPTEDHSTGLDIRLATLSDGTTTREIHLGAWAPILGPDSETWTARPYEIDPADVQKTPTYWIGADGTRLRTDLSCIAPPPAEPCAQNSISFPDGPDYNTMGLGLNRYVVTRGLPNAEGFVPTKASDAVGRWDFEDALTAATRHSHIGFELDGTFVPRSVHWTIRDTQQQINWQRLNGSTGSDPVAPTTATMHENAKPKQPLTPFALYPGEQEDLLGIGVTMYDALQELARTRPDDHRTIANACLLEASTYARTEPPDVAQEAGLKGKRIASFVIRVHDQTGTHHQWDIERWTDSTLDSSWTIKNRTLDRESRCLPETTGDPYGISSDDAWNIFQGLRWTSGQPTDMHVRIIDDHMAYEFGAKPTFAQGDDRPSVWFNHVVRIHAENGALELLYVNEQDFQTFGGIRP